MMNLRKIVDVIIAVVAVAMGVYHLVSSQYFIQGLIQHENTHLAFALVLVFLMALRKTRRGLRPLMLMLLVLSIVSTGYVAVFYDVLIMRPGIPPLQDVIVGVILLIVVFFGAWQTTGFVLPVTGLIFASYTIFGHLLPHPLYHDHIPFVRIISFYSIALQTGIYGTVLGASARYIFLFVLFGGILQETGAINFFMQLGRWVGRLFRAGAAMSAVSSSALVGMVTGSPSANITLTGSFTIPLMKKQGYMPHQAAAIEAGASIAGQIMPPVMGSVAFIMAELLAIPYLRVCLMAVIPALLYYFSIGAYAQLQAIKHNISPLREEVNFKELMFTAPLFIVPLIILIVLLVMQHSPMYSAFWAIIALFTLNLTKKETRSPRRLLNGFVQGAATGALIAMGCAIMGQFITTITMTGLGLKIPNLIEMWSGGNLVLTLIMAIAGAVILGMGSITLVSYLLVVMLVAPALLPLGVPLEITHFFVLFAAVSSGLTPPVALAALVAAGLAGANYMKTAVESVKVGLGFYVIPFLFIGSPCLLLLGNLDPLSVITTIVASAAGLLAIMIAMVGCYLVVTNPLERLMAALSAAGSLGYCIVGNYYLFGMGQAILILLTIWQWRKRLLLKQAERVTIWSQARI